MSLSLVVLLIIFTTIALRGILKLPLKIWQIVLIGALIVLFTKQITPEEAYASINWEVLFYLFGVFVIGRGLEESGLLDTISFKLFRHIKEPHLLLLATLFLSAISSAILMNDTIAIVGTTSILFLTRRHPEFAKPLLLGLAVSITFGSLLTPVGNPQNLLIASNGELPRPFTIFFTNFIIPTILNIFITYALIALIYRKQLSLPFNAPNLEPISHPNLANYSSISVILLCLMILFNILSNALHFNIHLDYSAIAVLSCLPILFLSRHRFEILRTMDWESIIFFASMFVLIRSIWETDFIQNLILQNHHILTNSLAILVICLLASQIISNLPLVVLYLPILMSTTEAHEKLLTLAAGSALAGNFTLLGAASTVIIIQTAEKRGHEAFGFFEFMGLGIPLTLCSLLVYYYFI